MPIFTAEIAGRPTVVLAARDYVAALAFVNDDFIRPELAGLQTPDGAPLWDGDTAVTVRPANKDEKAIWESNLVEPGRWRSREPGGCH